MALPFKVRDIYLFKSVEFKTRRDDRNQLSLT